MATIVYLCCFWFSLRLGSIIIAVFCILKAIFCLTTHIILIGQDLDITRSYIEKVLINVFNKAIVDFVIEEMRVIFIVNASFIGTYISSCILLIIGSISCKPRFCYLFLLLHTIWILISLLFYVILTKYLMYLTFIPEDVLDTSMFRLGYIILYLTLGIFWIFFEIYLVLCVYSFTEVVNSLRKELTAKRFAPAIKLTFKTEKNEPIETPVVYLNEYNKRFYKN